MIVVKVKQPPTVVYSVDSVSFLVVGLCERIPFRVPFAREGRVAVGEACARYPGPTGAVLAKVCDQAGYHWALVEPTAYLTPHRGELELKIVPFTPITGWC